MKKNIILIISFFILSVLSVSSTYACSCIAPPPPNEAKDVSTNVFIWTVSGIKEKNSFNSYDKYEVKLSWIKNIKWEWSDVKTVYTAQSSASCWFNFEEWKEYIIYTNGDNNKQNVSLCSRTALTENAKEDIETFKNIIEKNESKKEEWKNLWDTTKKENSYLFYLILIIITLLITLWILKIKNKR